MYLARTGLTVMPDRTLIRQYMRVRCSPRCGLGNMKLTKVAWLTKSGSQSGTVEPGRPEYKSRAATFNRVPWCGAMPCFSCSFLTNRIVDKACSQGVKSDPLGRVTARDLCPQQIVLPVLEMILECHSTLLGQREMWKMYVTEKY